MGPARFHVNQRPIGQGSRRRLGERVGGWEVHEKGVASKLMAKMGYVRGSGLGKHAQGRTEILPIPAPRRGTRDCDVRRRFSVVACRERPYGRLSCSWPCHVSARDQTRRLLLYLATVVDDPAAGALAACCPAARAPHPCAQQPHLCVR